MAKAIKYISITAGIILLLFVALIVAIPLFFDPNDFKPQISTAVKDATGRDLIIDGDIELSLFPWIGMELGRVTLSNAAGFDDAPFARIDSAEVKIKLLPLFKKQVEMKAVTLQGLNVNLQIAADGTSNWADLSQPTTETTPSVAAPAPDTSSAAPLAALAIGGLNINNATISYDDSSTNSHYRIDEFNLNTGPVSLTTPLDIKLNTKVHSEQPQLDGHIDLATRLGFDLDKEQYTLKDLILKIDAASRDIPGGNAALLLKGDIATDLKNQTARISGLELSSRGLLLNGDISVQQLLSALPHFKGRLALAEFNPKKLLQTLEIEAPVTADPTALTKASLDMLIDGNPETINIQSITILLDQSRLSGNATTRFSTDTPMPAVRYSLNLDSIDADRYLPPPTEGETATPATPATPATAGAAAVALPLETLRALNIDGQTTVGQLKVSGLNVSEIRADIKAKDGLIRLHPLAAKLYQGQYQGDTQLDVRGETPKITINESLQGIEAGPLLKDLIGDDKVSGKGNITAKLSTSGQTPDDMTRALNGDISLAFKDGAFKDFNLAQKYREAKAKIKKEPLPAKGEQRGTDFTELTGTFKVINGVIHNNDLATKAPFVRINGEGTADLVHQQLDYLVNAAIVKTEEGAGGAALDELKGLKIPIKITGSFTDPKIDVQIDEILKARAKQELERAKAELKAKAEAEKARLKAELDQKLEAEKAAARKKLEEEQARLKQMEEQKKQELKQKAEDKLKGLFR